jgi:hypothetical protein
VIYKCTQLTPKTASVVPPEDRRLTPETCRRLRHNKVIVKVTVYEVSYVIVIHNDTLSTKYQTPTCFGIWVHPQGDSEQKNENPTVNLGIALPVLDFLSF